HLCPAVSPTCAQKCHPPVPSSATHLCHPTVQPQCHPPVQPSSATHQCSPAVPPTSAAQQCCQSVPRGCSSQCCQSVPSSDASQCRLSVPIISVTYQCCILVPPIRDTSLVLPISAL
ncbi:unnamed protein product, partial [Staurois parvus]